MFEENPAGSSFQNVVWKKTHFIHHIQNTLGEQSSLGVNIFLMPLQTQTVNAVYLTPSDRIVLQYHVPVRFSCDLHLYPENKWIDCFIQRLQNISS